MNNGDDTRRADMRDLGPAGVLAIFWVLCPAILGFVLLASLGPVTTWMESLGVWAPVVFAAIFAITSGLGLLPTYAQAVAGGWIFGLTVGFGASLAGFVGGAAIGWMTARLVSRRRVENAIARHPHAQIVKSALVDSGWWKAAGLITLIRVPPNSPFALTNLVMAACGIRLGMHLVGTGLGMSPRTGIIVFLGAAGASSGAEDLQAYIQDGPGPWMMVIGIITLIIALAIITALARRAITAATSSASEF